MPGTSLTVTVIVVMSSLVAAVTDVWRFKVYNRSHSAAAAVRPSLPRRGQRLSEAGWTEVLNSLLGLLFGFGILFLFYLMGGMGAGDVKLMAAIGAWLGMPLTFYVFVASSLAGGLYAVVLIVASGRVRETPVNLQILWLRLTAFSRHLGADARIESEVKRADRRRRLIPFAAMVAVGIILVAVWFWLGGGLSQPLVAGR